MKTSFFLTDVSYKVVDGKPVIYLFGTKDNKQFCAIDRTFEPYIYAKYSKDQDFDEVLKIKKEENKSTFSVTRIEKVSRKWMGKEATFIKVFFNVPSAIPVLKNEIKDVKGISDIFEHDIFFTKRYLMDKNLVPMTLLEIEGKKVDLGFRVETIEIEKITKKDDTLAKPRILSFDIETYNPDGKRVDSKQHPILMIAIYGEDTKKVITWKEFKTKDKTIEFVKDEKTMLENFRNEVVKYQPDMIVGYYSDGFDFPYIKTRAEKNNVKLDFGLDNSELEINGKSITVSEIKGIMHIDVCKFIQKVYGKTMKTDIYTLDAVSNELLGHQKHDVDIENLAKYWDETNAKELETFCKYNLYDSKLTYDLAVLLLPNMLEIVKLVGFTMFDTTRMAFSQLVEWFIIKQASLYNETIPNKPSQQAEHARMHERAKGAFVFEPKPGLYENVAIFDYLSMYPNIIASHNLSADSFQCKCCKDVGRVPLEGKDYWFCQKNKGFISTIIEYVIKTRADLKKKLKQTPEDILLAARVQALKLLANSIYGYLGFGPARWYCFECQESTTAWGRQHIMDVIKEAENAGFKVIYSDTDSVFMLLNKKTKDDVLKFAKSINDTLPGQMEFDFEGIYPAALFVPLKSSDAGAKKKYALLSDKGDLKIKGFETVRRNISPVAKRVQREVLRILLQDKDPQKAVKYVKQTITELKEHKLPVDDVVIFTKLTKDIDNYTAVGPHVAAAMRMKANGINVGAGTPIYYVIVNSKDKKSRIRDNVKLASECSKEDYDADYYINNQIIPAIDRILEVFNIREDDLLPKKQRTLGSFE